MFASPSRISKRIGSILFLFFQLMPQAATVSKLITSQSHLQLHKSASEEMEFC